jgi:hypothetical protein
MEIESTTLTVLCSQKLHLRSHHFGTSNGQRLTIHEDGKKQVSNFFGIGGKYPYYSLDIPANGVGAIGYNLYLRYFDVNNDLMFNSYLRYFDVNNDLAYLQH